MSGSSIKEQQSSRKRLEKLSGNDRPYYIGEGVINLSDVNVQLFQVMEDTVVSELLDKDGIDLINSASNQPYNFSGITLKQGFLINCGDNEHFKSITVDSGSLEAFGSKPE